MNRSRFCLGTTTKVRFFDFLIYLCAAAAIEWRFFALPGHQGVHGSPTLQFALTCAVWLLPLLLFVAAYVRLVFDPSLSKTKKILAVGGNGCAVAVAVYYLHWIQWSMRGETPFSSVLVFVVLIPATFAITAALILYSRTAGYIVGSITVLLAWAYVTWLADVLWIFPSPYLNVIAKIVAFACFVSPMIFVAGSLAIFSRPRLGYVVGLIASALAWPYFVHQERSYLHWGNSWNMLNVPDSILAGEVIPYAELTIVAILLLVVATVCSLVRLCPARWAIKTVPLRDRIWPVSAISFVVSAIWFVFSVTPYTVPRYHHGIDAEISIVHVEKRGFHFRETRISASKEGKVDIMEEERKLLRYRSQGVAQRVALDSEHLRKMLDLVQSPEFKALHTARTVSPLQWNVETWYIYRAGSILIYSNVDKTEPPKEIVKWFHEVESIPATDDWKSTASKDVCLGFCYDPMGR